MRELKGPAPPFIELRFKPPKYDLRLFGRFATKDGLILTTHGMKSLSQKTGQKKVIVRDERKRCDDAFKVMALDLNVLPQTIRACIPEANFA
jgi:hypothetical protein